MNERRVELSVIIPTRDRLAVLRRVLDGMQLQDIESSHFEVIVIDDGSRDATREFLKSIAKSFCAELICLQGRREGPAAARNLGIAAAKGHIVLFLDADTIPSPQLLRCHLELHNAAAFSECHMGRIEMSPELMEPGQARWNELRLAADNPVTREINFRRYRTANTSLARAALLKVGGFEESLPAAEDLELAYRLAQQGMRFYYHEDVVAVHHHPLTLEDYYQKGAVYGRAVARWQRMQPDLRPDLARRFGLYDAGLGWPERCRYFAKVMLVNRASIGLLTALGRGCRYRCFAASERLFKAVYGYYLRRSFSSSRLQPSL
jgi:glycosyltransferase involved in cell wall biosynthesis